MLLSREHKNIREKKGERTDKRAVRFKVHKEEKDERVEVAS
jgi:hypothetical protein